MNRRDAAKLATTQCCTLELEELIQLSVQNPTERIVIALLIMGWKRKDVAQILGCSNGTISNICKRVGERINGYLK